MTTTNYVVAPESEFFVVIATIKSHVFHEKTEQAANLRAAQLRESGFDVTIYREWDMVIKPTLLIPLEAESLKQN